MGTLVSSSNVAVVARSECNRKSRGDLELKNLRPSKRPGVLQYRPGNVQTRGIRNRIPAQLRLAS